MRTWPRFFIMLGTYSAPDTMPISSLFEVKNWLYISRLGLCGFPIGRRTLTLSSYSLSSESPLGKDDP